MPFPLDRIYSLRTLVTAACPLAMFLGGTGCYADVQSEPVVVEEPSAVVYVEGPPVVTIEEYPCEYYYGRPVYYVDGFWYYREGPRWAYYREEPVWLYDRRVVYYSDGYHTSDGGWHHDRAHVTAVHDGHSSASPEPPSHSAPASPPSHPDSAPAPRSHVPDRPTSHDQGVSDAHPSSPTPAPGAKPRSGSVSPSVSPAPSSSPAPQQKARRVKRAPRKNHR